ncbi:MAG: hypothetical protein RI841_16430, partial [Halomonas sp.]|uniref:hypothetical protein n=1 Tax=Halomonas sp. TaxID=1486246 RepID=UPI0028700E85
MHIQQLMSLVNGPEAGPQPGTGGQPDSAAFASTLARAAEGSERMPAAARHDQNAALSAEGRAVLSELHQALSQEDRQALEALSAQQGGALAKALARLQEWFVQAGHRAPGIEAAAPV